MIAMHIISPAFFIEQTLRCWRTLVILRKFFEESRRAIKLLLAQSYLIPKRRENMRCFSIPIEMAVGKLTPLLYKREKRMGKSFLMTRSQQKGVFNTLLYLKKADGTQVWADRPYGDGQVFVDRDFKGTLVFAGMEFGPLAKKGGQADVMYELPRNVPSAGEEVHCEHDDEQGVQKVDHLSSPHQKYEARAAEQDRAHEEVRAPGAS